MYKYAQIDTNNGLCIGVSLLAGEVEADHMLLLTPEDDVQPGDIWDGEEWSRPERTEPEPEQPDRTEQLEIESALLALELADTQIKVDRLEQEQADLLFLLVESEVI